MRFLARFGVALILALCCFQAVLFGQGEDDRLTNLLDAAGMFNERGYLKANSFSLDGNEIINNFNGNLIYELPLKYLQETQNGIHYDLKICYNGNVGHYTNAGAIGILFCPLQMNLPEWIISLNGYAIQVFNFENELFSWKVDPDALAGDTTSFDDDISAFVNGYHSCYTFRRGSGTSYNDHGVISILMGDGTIREFYSDSNDASYPHYMMYGKYNPRSKDDRSRGYLERFDCDSAYFTLFEENGIQVRFKVFEPVYKLCVNYYSTFGDRPKILLPISILDQMGHSINIEYQFASTDGNDTIWGRPVVESVGEIDFDWGALHPDSVFNQLKLKEGDSTLYTFDFSNDGESVSIWGDLNRAVVTSIKDAADRELEFYYSQYLRIFKNLKNIVPVRQFLSCGEDDLYYVGKCYYLQPSRLWKIDFPDGGSSYNTYYIDSSTQWDEPVSGITDTLAINHMSICTYYQYFKIPCRKTEYFDSLGRDPFFSNMIVANRKLSTDSSVISTDSLHFSWIDGDSDEMISEEDEFYTKYLVGRDNLQCADSVQKYIEYTYNYYPEKGPYSSNSRDRGWTIKLDEIVEKKNPGQGTELVRKKKYFWDTGYNATFMLESIRTTWGEESYSESYDYDWFGDPADETVNCLERKEITDAWGIITKTYYDTLYLEADDPDDFYSNSLIDSTVVFDSYIPMEVTATQFYTYGSANGYVGQPFRTIRYQLNEYYHRSDSVEEKYFYYKNNAFLPRDEGALRKKINPEGDSILYYYRDETPEDIEYYKLRYSGMLVGPLTVNFDNNGPFWYKKVFYKQSGSWPEAITTYRLVDDEGKLLWLIGPNQYSSEIRYDAIDRAKYIILPGGYAITGRAPDTSYSLTYTYDDEYINDPASVTTCTRTALFRYSLSGRVWSDGLGRAVQQDAIDSLGNFDSTLTEYDFANRAINMVDQLGHTTFMEYDHFDRNLKTIYPDPNQSFDSINHTVVNAESLGLDTMFALRDSTIFGTEYIDENGNSVFEYSDVRGKIRLGRILVTQDSTVALNTYFDYDSLGNLNRVIRPMGDETQYEYNDLRQLIYEWSSDYGEIYYVYDKNGRLVRMQDTKMAEMGEIFNSYWFYHEYDALGRTIETGIFDSLGTQLYPLKHYFHDQSLSELSLGRLSLAYCGFPDGSEEYGERYHYDGRGRIIRQVNYFDAGLDSVWINDHWEAIAVGDSVVIQYGYNLVDQITSITYPDGMEVTYDYDNLGRLMSVGIPDDSDFFAALTYTPRNEIERMRLGTALLDSGLQTVGYYYNERGWLTSINEGASGSSAPADLFTQHLFYYDSLAFVPPDWRQYNGNICCQYITMPGRADLYAYHYDESDRLVESGKIYVPGALKPDESFAYDLNGNRERYVLHINGVDSLATDYEYGSSLVNHLFRATGGQVSRYLYDGNGNMIWDSAKHAVLNYGIFDELAVVEFDEELGINELIFGYNTDNQRICKSYSYYYMDDCPTDTVSPDEPVVPDGDKRGEKDGESALPWLDSRAQIENQLGYSLPEYYGDRTADSLKESGPGSNKCLYHRTERNYYVRAAALGGKVLTEQPCGTSATFRFAYIYAGDQRIAMYDNDYDLFFFLNDHLGSARVVVRSDGTIMDKHRYYAFGAAEDSQDSTRQGYRYTGKMIDMENGLDIYYYGARYYDPELGRFLSMDPLADRYPSWSPYVYAADNPIKNIDPDGRGWFSKLVKFIIKGGDIGATFAGVVEDAGILFGNNSSLWERGGAFVSLASEALPVSLRDAKAGAKFVDNVVDKVKSARKAATRKAWKEEKKIVEKTGKGTKKWTKAETEQLKTQGKVEGYEAHHINSVKDNPDMAGNPNNVEFVTRKEHLEKHGGNWRKQTSGELKDREVK